MIPLDPDFAQALCDSLDTGIIVLENDLRVSVWNEWLHSASGVAGPDAVGLTLPELFPGRDLKTVLAAVKVAVETGTARLLTHSLHPDLLPLKTRTRRTLIHDMTIRAVGAGSPRCLIQIADVTVAAERKKVLIARQNARYDAVVESALDVILTLDSNGDILLANPAAVGQFGYTAEALIGTRATSLFQDSTLWDMMWRGVLTGERLLQPIEVVAIRKNGSRSYLEVTLSRWLSDSRIFVTAILRDVNERHRAEEVMRELNATLEFRVEERTSQLMEAEEALRQSQKMEAVGQLTGGIAHDFNNLLQGIIGAIDRVQHRIQQGRIGDIDRLLNGAMTSANRAAALTHRLLAFSRRQPVDPRPTDLRELISSIEELLRRTIGESLELKVTRAPDLWTVRCDVNQLENALLNLAINARDAMPHGGTLTIETMNKTLDRAEALKRELEPGEYVCLIVRDTGVGMPPDVKARAFDPFYTTKPIGQGTGLGLSMIYGFVRQSDGSVRIESEVDQGTTIEMCFPRYRGDMEEAAEDEPIVDRRSDSRDEIVLVVEDENVVRLLIVDILNDLGYHVLEVIDGPSALRIIQSSQRIDLLVTDIGLPGLNGRQLADAALIKRPNLKILFMTGYAETAASSFFLEHGMEIITKPFTMDALAKRILRITENLRE